MRLHAPAMLLQEAVSLGRGQRLPPGAETRADESDVAFKRRDPDERRIDVESGMPGHGARCCE